MMLTNGGVSQRELEATSNGKSVLPFDRKAEWSALDQGAANGEGEGPTVRNFASAWEQFARGALRVVRADVFGDTMYVTVEHGESAEAGGLTHAEAGVLFRVLCGEQQKAVAADLSIAPSTASHRCVAALRKIGVARGAVPLPVVLAAQQASGLAVGSSAQVMRFEHGGRSGIVLSVRRPDLRRLHALTRAEQDVAVLFIEGRSRPEIAQCRGTSVLTVAGQVHAIFSALRLSGRYALIRRAGELGCF